MAHTHKIFEVISETIQFQYQSGDDYKLENGLNYLIFEGIVNHAFIIKEVHGHNSESFLTCDFSSDRDFYDKGLQKVNPSELEDILAEKDFLNLEVYQGIIEGVKGIYLPQIIKHVLILPIPNSDESIYLVLAREYSKGSFKNHEINAFQLLVCSYSQFVKLKQSRQPVKNDKNGPFLMDGVGSAGMTSLDCFPSPSFWFSPGTMKVRFGNREFHEAYQLGSVHGRRIDELIKFPVTRDEQGFIQQLNKGMPVKNIEAKVWNAKHNTFRWCSLYAGLLEIEGEKGVVVSVHDIQKRKDFEKKTQKLTQLLKTVNETQISFFVKDDFHNILKKLLDAMVKITSSEYGFIGEVFKDDNGNPYLKTHVVSEVAWPEGMLRRFGNSYDRGLDFRNLDTLLGACLKTGQAVVANEVHNDSRSGGIPIGNLEMHRFLGVPVYAGDEMVGLMGFANRQEPYTDEDIDFLEPIIEGYGSFIRAIRFTREKYKSDLLREESETMYEILSENTGDILMLLSPDLKVNYVSPSVEKVIGYSPDDILGKSLWEFFESDKQIFQEVETKIILKIKHKVEKKTILLEYLLKDMGYAGTMVGYLGTFRNVTERETAHMSLKNNLFKERELSQLKSRFIRMTSHELRTPLTTLLSSSELLALMVDNNVENDSIKIKMKNHIQKMSNQINRLIKVINDILILEKNTAGKDQIRKEKIPIIHFLRELVESQLNEGDVKFKIEMEFPGEERAVYSDPVWLGYIVRNILENAVKYSKNAGKEPILSLTYGEREFEIHVKDFGIGIPQDDQKYIFGSFFRAKNASNIRGAGLGLNIVKEFVERLGGEIGFTSCEKEGTIFSVRLPYGLNRCFNK